MYYKEFLTSLVLSAFSITCKIFLILSIYITTFFYFFIIFFYFLLFFINFLLLFIYLFYFYYFFFLFFYFQFSLFNFAYLFILYFYFILCNPCLRKFLPFNILLYFWLFLKLKLTFSFHTEFVSLINLIVG